MPSADQVPVKSPHSTTHWHEWVVLIAGSTGSALRAVRPSNRHITPDVRRDFVHAATGLTHGCTDQACNVKFFLANSEPSTHGTKL
jgi:hypothetical protein